MKLRTLFLAGIGNSGPGHWQRLWHERLPGSQWVEHEDWDWPSAKTWLADLERTLGAAPEPCVAIAHSLGCLLLGQWLAGRTGTNIQAAFLVAPPDAEGPNFPEGLGFSPGWSQDAFKVPSLVVASRNDPYGSLEQAGRCAQAWGSGFVDAGDNGHLNADSGLGAWPAGWALLESLLQEPGTKPHFRRTLDIG